MNPVTLILISRQLAKIGLDETPLDDELRKAISCAYYALFHALCNCVADHWVGMDEAMRDSDAWVQAYRLLEHGKTKAACIKICNRKSFRSIRDSGVMTWGQRSSPSPAQYGFRQSVLHAKKKSDACASFNGNNDRRGTMALRSGPDRSRSLRLI